MRKELQNNLKEPKEAMQVILQPVDSPPKTSNHSKKENKKPQKAASTWSTNSNSRTRSTRSVKMA